MKPVGVLALQGDFQAHAAALSDVGIRACAVRTAADLAAVRALVLPGGESTAMLRLMEPEGLSGRIAERVGDGMALLATCAGTILAARRVEPAQHSLAVLAVVVRRNAYGRQLQSSVHPLTVAKGCAGPREMEGVFIRAPRIVSVDHGVEVLAHRDDEPVLVRQDHVLAATFHPELSSDRRVHHWFAEVAGRD